MKNQFLRIQILSTLLLLAVPFAQAQKSVQSEYVFSLNEDTGPVRKLTIQLQNDGKSLRGSINATLNNKKEMEGSFTCQKNESTSEINCYREDGGGEFYLLTKIKENKTEYILKFKTFDVSDEDAEETTSVSSPNEDEYFEVVGIKN